MTSTQKATTRHGFLRRAGVVVAGALGLGATAGVGRAGVNRASLAPDAELFEQRDAVSKSVSQPDYLIYQLGSSIYASALRPGLSTHSGSSTDAGRVIQQAINALKGTGGLISLKGTLTMNSGIASYPAIGIVGQGPLSAAAPFGTSQLVATSNVAGPVITLEVDPGNPTWTYFPYLANFSISGTQGPAGQAGIYITSAKGSILDCYIQNVNVFGVGGNGLDANAAPSVKLWIDNCYFEHCQQNAIQSRAYALRVTNSYIFGNRLQGISAGACGYMQVSGCELLNNAGGAISMVGVALGGTIIGNTFFENGADGGVGAFLIQGMSGTQPIIVSNNIFHDDRGAAAVASFLYCGLKSDVNAVIQGNAFSGQTGPAIRRYANRAGDKYIIQHNAGYNEAVGQIANPVDNARKTISTLGTTSLVVASTDYVIRDVSQYVVVTGGTGVSITVKDPAGNTVESGSASYAKVIPIGFRINFGAFSVAPTVASFVT